MLINSSSSEDQGVYSCVASNGVGDAVVVDTELIIGKSTIAVHQGHNRQRDSFLVELGGGCRTARDSSDLSPSNTLHRHRI